MKKLTIKSAVKKIDHPLAKYNSGGQLFCVLCNTQVKSEMFWTGHVNGRSHQDALLALKSKKRPQASSSNGSGEDDSGPSPKKKMLTTIAHSERENDKVDSNFKIPFPVSPFPPTSSTSTVTSRSEPPSFVGREVKRMETNEDEDEDEDEDDMESQNQGNQDPPKNGLNLPEGFFDDPKEDARIRGKEWRDPEELEWERFTKEIANEELKSSSLRVQDEEDSTKTRELEEIEEQMAHWQKVIDLERKAEEAKKLRRAKDASAMAVDDDEDLEDYEEEMDWRSKRH